jgi:hypothetical protein
VIWRNAKLLRRVEKGQGHNAPILEMQKVVVRTPDPEQAEISDKIGIRLVEVSDCTSDREKVA